MQAPNCKIKKIEYRDATVAGKPYGVVITIHYERYNLPGVPEDEKIELYMAPTLQNVDPMNCIATRLLDQVNAPMPVCSRKD